MRQLSINCSTKYKLVKTRLTQSVLLPMLLVSLSVNASASCDGLKEQTTATASELFDSAENCDSLVDATFLMILGQIRALTDIEVFPSKAEKDKEYLADLYSRLYYQMGGSGPDQMYRVNENYISLIERLKAWTPGDLVSYEPGWAYSSAPAYSGYTSKIESTKAIRLEQLNGYHSLLADDEYYGLKIQVDEILARNKNTLTGGTPDAEEYSRLSEAMNKVTKRIRQSQSK